MNNLAKTVTKPIAIALLILTNAHAGETISSYVPTTFTLSPDSTTVKFYVRKITVNSDNNACITPNLNITLPIMSVKHTFASWGSQSESVNSEGAWKVAGSLSNKCNTVQNGNVTVNYTRSGESQTATLPYVLAARTDCAVTVDTTPVIPTLVRGTGGTTTESGTLLSSPTGAGSIAFKPDQSDTTGGILSQSDGTTIQYQVTGGTWNADSNQWSGDTTTDYRVKVLIPYVASSGKYTGSMTATISCE